MNDNTIVTIPLGELVALIISAYRAGLVDHLDIVESQIPKETMQ